MRKGTKRPGDEISREGNSSEGIFPSYLNPTKTPDSQSIIYIPKKPKLSSSSNLMSIPRKETCSCPSPSSTLTCSRPSPSSTLTTTPAGESSTTGTPASNTRSAHIRKFRPQRSATPKPTPSSANPDNHSSDSRKEGEVHDETHQEDRNIARKLSFVDETTEEVLKQMAKVEPKNEIDLEIENLLKILSSSNPQLQNVAKKVGEASMLLQKGVTLMTTVRKLLLAAFTDILPTSAE